MTKETNNPSKCLKCKRPTHKKSKYCIFHASAREKTELEFKGALSEYIEVIKKEDNDYNFRGFIFVGDINFKKDLNITIFKNARFVKATFKGYAVFQRATFVGDTVFQKATFEKDAIFKNATFERDIVFRKVIFEGIAVFRETIFKGSITFREATFKGDASFKKIIFKKHAVLREITFEGSAVFWETIFEDDANFKLHYLVKFINFSRIKVLSGKRLFVKLNNKEGKISFDRAYLENTNLDIELVKNTLIDFTGALLRNTNMQREQIENHILQEEKGEYLPAKKIYLLLKNNFHSIGQYEDESWAYKKEKDMERKSNCHFKSLHKWLWSCFLNGIFGYGIQPSKVIMSAILIITLFAFLFMNPGISNIVGIEEITSNNFFDCLYFSTITFTTLGYGDFRPLEGWGRILAGSEAFIGAFMMALFVYTFARRTGGR